MNYRWIAIKMLEFGLV
jgi:hypothetical protein